MVREAEPRPAEIERTVLLDDPNWPDGDIANYVVEHATIEAFLAAGAQHLIVACGRPFRLDSVRRLLELADPGPPHGSGRAAPPRARGPHDGRWRRVNRMTAEVLGDFLRQPWLATLATYRKDGRVLLSPVWWEWAERLQISADDGDWKEKHVRRNPRVNLCIAEEASYPGRAMEARGIAKLIPDPMAPACCA